MRPVLNPMLKIQFFIDEGFARMWIDRLRTCLASAFQTEYLAHELAVTSTSIAQGNVS